MNIGDHFGTHYEETRNPTDINGVLRWVQNHAQIAGGGVEDLGDLLRT